MTEKTLFISQLCKNYGDIKAVDHVSFDVGKGQIMGLLGPNGAGKSTVIRMIMGILSKTSGTVEYVFNDKKSLLDKSKVGYLPEERGLYDDVKVIDNLAFLGVLKGLSDKRARERAMPWLERLDLQDYADKKLEKLSKGMQQKVQFIGAVLHEPTLVILDEPFSGLDPVNQDLFKDLIREIADKGASVLLSAHQMGVVEELCTSIYMIHKGKQVLYGNINKIKRDYKEYMIRVTGEARTDWSFLEKRSKIADLCIKQDTVTFRYESEQGVSKLTEELAQRVKIVEIKVEKPPLHDIFVSIVRDRGGKIDEQEVV